MPTLYLVGTPIGNLEDITLRALRILGEVELIAAEDTRVTGRLLERYQIETPLVSYHEHSSPRRITELLEKAKTSDVALVSSAGTPALSDPGYRLIRAAAEAGVPVVSIPGPSAAVAALVSSGLPTDRFLFLGFVPKQKKARRQLLSQVADLPYTLVLYEAPHRVLDLLADVKDVLGERAVSVGRELTKLHEETVRGSISQVLAHFREQGARGEFTVVIAGASPDESIWEEAAVRMALRAELAQGRTKKEASAAVATLSGWRKRDVYRLALEISSRVSS